MGDDRPPSPRAGRLRWRLGRTAPEAGGAGRSSSPFMATYDDDAIHVPSMAQVDDNIIEATTAGQRISIPFPPHWTLPVTSEGQTAIQDQLWDYAVTRVVPELWSHDGPSLALIQQCAFTRSLGEFHLIRQDESYSAALSAVSAVLALMMSREMKASTLRAHAFRSYGQALALVRNRIQASQAIGNVLLLTIFWFSVFETMNGRPNHARIHLSAIPNLVAQSPGLQQNLEAWIAANVVSCDVYLAVSSDTVPIFAASGIFAKGEEPAAASSMAATTTTDFSVQPGTHHAWTSLRELFHSLAHVQNTDGSVQTFGPSQDDGKIHSLLVQRLSCISRIVQARHDLRSNPDSHACPQTQLGIYEAMLLWAFLVFGCPEPVRLGAKLLLNLQSALLSSDIETEEEPGNALTAYKTWATLVGCLQATVLPEAESLRIWFERRVALTENASGLVGSVLKSGLPLPLEQLRSEIASTRTHRHDDTWQGLYTVSGLSWRGQRLQTRADHHH
ncbi:hypothetical protein AYO22_06747 [Fonsecaea multimorphosa]|nr:hypothetical protein AYO22_06747 [Fonsecaea multimorphosa]